MLLISTVACVLKKSPIFFNLEFLKQPFWNPLVFQFITYIQSIHWASGKNTNIEKKINYSFQNLDFRLLLCAIMVWLWWPQTWVTIFFWIISSSFWLKFPEYCSAAMPWINLAGSLVWLILKWSLESLVLPPDFLLVSIHVFP